LTIELKFHCEAENYASRKLEGGRNDNSQLLVLICMFSLKIGYPFDK